MALLRSIHLPRLGIPHDRQPSLERDVTRENYHKRTDVSAGRKEGRSSPAAMKNDAVSLGKQLGTVGSNRSALPCVGR